MKKINMQLLRSICAASFEQGLGVRAIAKAVPGAAVATVSRIIGKVQALNRPWSELSALSEEDLSRLLYGTGAQYLEPDYESIHASVLAGKKRT